MICMAVPGGGHRILWERKHLRDAADLLEQNPMDIAGVVAFSASRAQVPAAL
jgi:hypothetical protein